MWTFFWSQLTFIFFGFSEDPFLFSPQLTLLQKFSERLVSSFSFQLTYQIFSSFSGGHPPKKTQRICMNCMRGFQGGGCTPPVPPRHCCFYMTYLNFQNNIQYNVTHYQGHTQTYFFQFNIKFYNQNYGITTHQENLAIKKYRIE